MANGQITDQKFSLEIPGGTTVEFVDHNGTIIEGVLSKSPTGEWEIVSPTPDLILKVAQSRFVGSRVSVGSIQTTKINPKNVSIIRVTLRENKPTLNK